MSFQKPTALGVVFILGAALVTSCTSKLSRFDLIKINGAGGDHQITRAEVGDQGPGTAQVNGGHSLSKVTIGGWYLRHNDASASNHRMALGLHANPLATQ